MEGSTGSRDAFNDGDQVAVAAFDLLDPPLIAVDKCTNPIADSELDSLVTQNTLE